MTGQSLPASQTRSAQAARSAQRGVLSNRPVTAHCTRPTLTSWLVISQMAHSFIRPTRPCASRTHGRVTITITITDHHLTITITITNANSCG
jgi:hypothetical protein